MKAAPNNRYAHVNRFIEQQPVQVALTQQKQYNTQQQQQAEPSPVPELANDLPIENFFGALDTEIGITAEKAQLAVEQQRLTDQQQQQQTETKETQEQQKETKEEQQQKETKEDAPRFERKKETKPDKDESIEILRKQRDEANQRIKELTDGFGETNPSILVGLFNQIKDEIEGPLTADAITDWLKSNGATKAQISEIQGQLQDARTKLTEYDINNSDEFKKNYYQPANEKYKELLYSFAVPTRKADGSEGYVAPLATQKLHNFLTGDAAKIDPASVTMALREYANDFKKESGEDAPILNTGSILRTVREYQEKLLDMHNAKANWQQTKEKNKLAAEQQKQYEQEAQRKQSRRERVGHYTEAYQSYDHESIEDIVDEKTLKDIFDQGFKTAEEFFEGKAPMSYVDIAKRGADADVMAHLRSSGVLAEMVKLYKAHKANKEVRGNGDRRTIPSITGGGGGGGKVDFLGDFALTGNKK